MIYIANGNEALACNCHVSNKTPKTCQIPGKTILGIELDNLLTILRW
jgi:hypothetical protein